jgi:peptide/nickel transport system substrate-binding protein
MSASDSTPSITRRQLLAGASAGALGASSGCIQRVRSIFNRNSPDAASVSIVTSPADDDQLATSIANQFAANLEEVGIETEIKYLPYVELYREVLLNSDFDMFIARMPYGKDPDLLRDLLESRFAEEPGWQNPYQYTSIPMDGALKSQRTTAGNERETHAKESIRLATAEQPFVTIGYQYPIRAVYNDLYSGWDRFSAWSPLTYYGLEPDSASRGGTLQISVTDARVTRNLNPLSAEYRDRGTFIRLLYDPLVYRTDDETLPWLAKRVEWGETTDGTTATVTLRPNLQWHDGDRLTAEDVAFTYRFLQDTSLGEMSVKAVAPRYRGESSLVENVTELDDSRVRFTFGETSGEVARRAMTVPILPKDQWIDETGQADVSGIDIHEGVTDGSGPLQFESIDSGATLELVRNPNHFFNQGPPPELMTRLGDGLAFDRIELQTAPSHETAIEVLSSGGVDATAATVSPTVVGRIEDDPDLTLFVHDEDREAPYHIGFNAATEPFSNPYFRRLIGRLLDKNDIVDNVFEGYGQPATNPFDGTDWNPTDLAFDSTDPVIPFFGSNGVVDVDAAREAFEERGFDFNDNDRLVLR